MLARIFRKLPSFKGKYTLGAQLLKNKLYQKTSRTFEGKWGIQYSIPNTIEQVGRELYINGVFEPKTISLIRKLLPAGGVFFDVGANIGSISLPIARNTGVQVHSFEPSWLSFSYLQKNVNQNDISNMTLNQAAVFSEDGQEQEFYEAEEKYGNSSLSSTFAGQPHYRVHTISLDAYCKRKGIHQIDVLKIDVQGYELHVLQGARKMLQSHAIKEIIFEMEAWAEKQAGFNAGDAQRFLQSMGYTIYDLNERPVPSIITEGSAMFLAKGE